MIEDVLERIATALEKIAAKDAKTTAPKTEAKTETKAAAKTDAKKATKPAATKKATAPAVDYEQVKTAAMDAVELITRDSVASVLAEFGAAKLNQLSEGDFAAFIERIKEESEKANEAENDDFDL